MLLLLRHPGIWILPAYSAAATTAYHVAAWVAAGAPGFPLDDSWIHQAIARSLALTGRWSINPGEPTGASTSPLWTGLLAPAHLLGVDPVLWAALLGVVFLAAVGWQTAGLARGLFPGSPWLPGVAAAVAVLEWRLVWAAASGMETLLFTALTLAALREHAVHGWSRQRRLGILLGVLPWVRPEGVLLGGLLGGLALLDRGRDPLRNLLATAAVAVGLVAPWVGLNFALAGRPFPSTFYAKNAAYGFAPDLARYAQFLGDATIELARGPLLVLLPGCAFAVALMLRQPAGERWCRAAPPLWAGVLVAVYMVWLPAVYHHGRYLIPVIPVLVIYGLAGGNRLLAALRMPLLARAAAALLVLVTLAGWGRGAMVFAANVALIEGQQVAAARWIAANTEPGAVVATHDIGAIAYFAGRPLVDLAGLASPELTDAPKDVPRVLDVIRQRGAAYVVILPAWYPPLFRGVREGLDVEPALQLPSPGPAPRTEETLHVLRVRRPG